RAACTCMQSKSRVRPSETQPFLLPAFREARGVGPRKACRRAVPFQKIARGIEVDGAGISMHGERRSAAHRTVVVAAAEQVEAELAELLHAVMRMRALEYAARARRAFAMDRDAADRDMRVPGDAHGIGQVEHRVAGAGLAVKGS